MKLLLAGAAAAGLALAHPVSAGAACILADQHGNARQYSVDRGGHGYTDESVVKRNGLTLGERRPSEDAHVQHARSGQ